jgi:hypothetical protein
MPKEWTFKADGVASALSPAANFAFGTWEFPTGGGCGPREAATTVPSDGMFLVMIEYDLEYLQGTSEFQSRPEKFDLGTLGGPTACLLTKSYGVLFHDRGRYFQTSIVFGNEVSPELREQTRQSLSSLRVERES